MAFHLKIVIPWALGFNKAKIFKKWCEYAIHISDLPVPRSSKDMVPGKGVGLIISSRSSNMAIFISIARIEKFILVRYLPGTCPVILKWPPPFGMVLARLRFWQRNGRDRRLIAGPDGRHSEEDGRSGNHRFAMTPGVKMMLE